MRVASTFLSSGAVANCRHSLHSSRVLGRSGRRRRTSHFVSGRHAGRTSCMFLMAGLNCSLQVAVEYRLIPPPDRQSRRSQCHCAQRGGLRGLNDRFTTPLQCAANYPLRSTTPSDAHTRPCRNRQCPLYHDAAYRVDRSSAGDQCHQCSRWGCQHQSPGFQRVEG
jgi:hypothetical protein